MKTVERRQWRRSGVFIVKCEHVSHIILIVDFKQVDACWVHVENTNAVEWYDQFYHALCCSIFSVNKIF